MKFANTLYLIDDDVMYHYIAERIIESADVTGNVFAYSNGREAIEAIEKNIESTEQLPDMILLDLMMPVMDGWGFLKNYELLKPQIGKEILIYIVTSSFNPIDIERAKQISDVAGYIVKPITRENFLSLFEQE